VGGKTFYLLQSRLVGETKYKHLAFGDNLKELIEQYVSFEDRSIDSYIITEFGSDRIVYRCFQEDTARQSKNQLNNKFVMEGCF
jgi:hypothetical protein